MFSGQGRCLGAVLTRVYRESEHDNVFADGAEFHAAMLDLRGLC